MNDFPARPQKAMSLRAFTYQLFCQHPGLSGANSLRTLLPSPPGRLRHMLQGTPSARVHPGWAHGLLGEVGAGAGEVVTDPMKASAKRKRLVGVLDGLKWLRSHIFS